MKQILYKLFYQLFRSKSYLDISGISKIFWSAEPRMHQRIMRAGGEREQLEYFLKQIQPGDVVWDVGAFIGMFSLFAEDRVGSEGIVYAFEPEHKTIELIQKNMAFNHSHNIKIVEAALGENDGEALIYSSDDDQNAISSLRPGHSLKNKGLPITIRRGDSLVNNNEVKVPNVIKMDVEGAEFGALKGMFDLLKNSQCRFLFLELHVEDLPRFNSSDSEVRDLLAEAGFTIDREFPRGTELHLYCSK